MPRRVDSASAKPSFSRVIAASTCGLTQPRAGLGRREKPIGNHARRASLPCTVTGAETRGIRNRVHHRQSCGFCSCQQRPDPNPKIKTLSLVSPRQLGLAVRIPARHRRIGSLSSRTVVSSRALNPRIIPLRLRAHSRHNLSTSCPARGIMLHAFARGSSVATSINRMGTAGILLAIAMCCGASEASAQLFLNVGGPGAQGNASIGTANLGIGGPGSAIELQGLNEPAVGSNRGVGLPLLNQQAGKPLGVNGNSTGTAQGSLSSAGDRSSSPVDSVTNTLMGPVSNLVSRSTNSGANPAGKRKQANNAKAGAVPPPR
jgi:hypothetical protein